MTTTLPGGGNRHSDIFASVFPQPDFSTPTPEATPELGVLSSPARPFGGPLASLDVTDEAVKLSQAWSIATRYLLLQSERPPNTKSAHAKAYQSLLYLVGSHVQRSQICNWYMNEIRTHFREMIVPELASWHQPIRRSDVTDLVDRTVQIAQYAQSTYLQPFEKLESQGYYHSLLKDFVLEIVHRWHVLLLHSLPRDRLQKALSLVFYSLLKQNLDDASATDTCSEVGECSCGIDIDEEPLHQLTAIGLGGEVAERALAAAVHRFLSGSAVQRRCFRVDWTNGKSVLQRLEDWVKNYFASVTTQAQSAVNPSKDYTLTETDVNQQVLTAVNALGRSRVQSLFDYVKLWPASKGAVEDVKSYLSRGQADEKAYVCSSYIEQIRSRLLHAGATTTEILSIYINTIHIFRHLDPRGVLLDKVALPIRQYLRTREDTVSVIAASFLADVNEEGLLVNGENDGTCVDIAIELDNAESALTQRDTKTLNWDDPNWTPDPIDAGPDFRSGRSEDVVGYIMGLFEQEDFIKEVTNVLAGHLLQNVTDMDYAKETRLVELMKARFDSSKLQSAEVMLKDVRDSVILNKRFAAANKASSISNAIPPTPKEIQGAIPDSGITINALFEPFAKRIDRARFVTALKLVAMRRGDLWVPKRTRLPAEPVQHEAVSPTAEASFHLQIVSSFFWPQMRTETFALPKQLEDRINEFRSFFERVSAQRQLQLRPALGRVTVELELEDRNVREENVTASRASVLDAFAENETSMENSQSDQPTSQITHTSEELASRLEMDEDLVLDALNFWHSRRVLYQPSPDTYAVLERLDMLETVGLDQAEEAEILPAATEDGSAAAIKSASALFREQAPTFEIFILNMLKNGGAKEVGGMMGITSMLKMVLPIYTYGEEEATGLLEEMEAKGMVSRNGDVWSAA